MNEVAQWIALVLLSFLMMGLCRHLALALPLNTRRDVTSGPALHKRLPREVVRAILHATPIPDTRDLVVAFLVESCVGCQRLLGELTVENTHFNHGIIIVAKNASPSFREALGEAGVPVIFDDGRIWDACGVENTPLVIRLDDEGRVVAKGVTHHVDTLATASV